MNNSLYELQFGLEGSARYHARRRAFFDLWHKIIMFLVILSGSAAFSGVFGAPQWIGLFVAGLGALDLVIGFSHKSRDHAVLHRRFVELISELQVSDESALPRLTQKRLSIEQDEPPIYKALSLACHNEIVASHGNGDEHAVPIGFWRHVLMHFCLFSDFNPSSQADLEVAKS